MKPLDEASRRLIDEATAADRPAPGTESRVWRSLAERLGDPLPPTAAAASRAFDAPFASSLWTSTSVKLLVSVVTAATLTGSAAVWYVTRTSPADAPSRERAAKSVEVQSPRVATQPIAPQPSAAGAHGGESPPAASPSQPVSPPPRAAGPASRSGEERGAPAAPQSASVTISGLDQETRLLSAAQRALNAGAAARALALLDEHRGRYAQGTLAQERDAARVLALCALGRARQAQREREAFSRNWPDSPLSSRVREPCDLK